MYNVAIIGYGGIARVHETSYIELERLGKAKLVAVFSRKASAYCMEMLDAAKAAGKRLMIGQCLHFFPEYEFLKDIAEDGRYGKVRSAFFQRLSAPPMWSKDNWIMKKENFGSCLHDLHIHDVDMCNYLFGTPRKIDVASGEHDHGKNHVRDAAETIRIILRLAESAEAGGEVLEYIKQ